MKYWYLSLLVATLVALPASGEVLFGGLGHHPPEASQISTSQPEELSSESDLGDRALARSNASRRAKATHKYGYRKNAVVEGIPYTVLTGIWWSWNVKFDAFNKATCETKQGPKKYGWTGYGYPLHKFYFLAGYSNEKCGNAGKRTCIIPKNKYILIPVINVGCPPDVGDKAADSKAGCQEYAKAGFVQDHVSATLDKTPVKVELINSGYVPWFNCESCPTLGYATGTWVLLPPLTPGTHRLTVKGFVDFDGNGECNNGGEFNTGGDFNPSARYKLQVK